MDLLAIRAHAPPRLDRVLDLSHGGARLATRAALPVGTSHTFLLIMPGPAARSEVATLDARVIWSTATELGLCFRNLHELVESYLERLAAGRGPLRAVPARAG